MANHVRRAAVQQHENIETVRPAAGIQALAESLRSHWPEYLIEAAGLGIFMVAACFATVLLEHPASALHQALPDPFMRRLLAGIAMGLTAVAIFYSPWGKRSGAHINPAVTLTFFRLGKVDPRDAVFYVLAQFIGAAAGVLLSAAVLGPFLSHGATNYAVTAPGAAGPAAAFAAEAVISFGMMFMVLATSSNPRLETRTALFAGMLVALYITFESPISGMSMNPARSLGSALPARHATGQWIYFVAPMLGMLLAAEVYLRLRGASRVACAKLHHANRQRCIFCQYLSRKC
jgi:aquaporin Z